MSSLFVAVRRAVLLCLPCAVVFAVGVGLSPRVAAQYPGGGDSYPGSSGWLPLANPNNPYNPRTNSNGTYDWTGLTVTYSAVSNAGYPPYNPPPCTSYDGVNPYMLEVGPADVIYNAAGFSGTSTYKWKWVPPLDASGAPD